MKIYTLSSIQFLPISLAEAWSFFSSPKNLSSITPANVSFDILYISVQDKMYEGQIIRYKIGLFPGVKMKWMTEITHVKEQLYFIDEQRFGPYALWHHQHHFKEVQGGVEMTDEVNYAIPYGLLGRLAHWLFVEKQLKSIFKYRFEVLEKRFSIRG